MAKRIATWRRWGRVAAVVAAIVTGAPEAVWGQAKKPNAAALEEVKQLTRELISLYVEGKYDVAIPLAERALAIREAGLGPEHPDVAISLNNLAGLYLAKGDYVRAEPLLRRALTIFEKALGSEHPDLATLLIDLTSVIVQQGDYGRAEEPLQRVLAIREPSVGPKLSEFAVALNNLALMYATRGKGAHAEALLVRAVAIWDKAEKLDQSFGSDVRNQSNMARSLLNLSDQCYERGDYARTESLLERALAIQEKALGSRHTDVADSLDMLGKLYVSTGKYAGAEQSLQLALTIRETSLGLNDLGIASTLNILSGVFYNRGEYSKAEQSLQRTITLIEKAQGSQTIRLAAPLNNLAAVHERRGDYAYALALSTRSLNIIEHALGPNHPDAANALDMLAIVCLAVDDFKHAELLMQGALALRENAFGTEHPDVASSMNNLAKLYHWIGNFQRADSLFQRALTITQKTLGPEHPEVVAQSANLAELYTDMGDYDRALPLLQIALSVGEKVYEREHPHLAIVLNDIAALHEAQNDIPRSLFAAQRGVSIDDQNAIRELAVGTNKQRRLYIRKAGRSAATTISLHLHSAPHLEDAKRLALRTVLRRKGLVLDAMANSFANLRERLPSDQRPKFDEWRALTTQYSTLVQRGPDKQPLEAFRALVKEVDDKRQKLENELSFISKDLQAQLKPVEIEQVRAALPTHAALVEFFRYNPFNPKAKGTEKRWGTPRFVAYVLHPDGKIDFADLGEAKPIENTVQSLREAVANKATDPNPAAKRLHQLVFAPIQKLLDKPHHLFLSPDGDLNLVPFEALLDEANHYVVESYAITYLPSGRDLVRQTSIDPRQPATVLTAPDYYAGDPAKPLIGKQYEALSDAMEEGDAVKNNLGNAKLVHGKDAAESTLKALHGPRVLHISTHGFFEKNLPALHEPPRDAFQLQLRPTPPVENALLRSGLALAGANRGGLGTDDGILTALEASQLDLYGTKLVVLSACNTGNGQTANGDGVYGLRRAFGIAGAETIVMSLWPIEGHATTEVMKSYYQRLAKGGGRAESLRQAQLAMLDDPNHAHPYYWAGFIVSGDERSMEGQRVEPTFGKVNQTGACGACTIGASEETPAWGWIGVVVAGAWGGMMRRRRFTREAYE